MRKLAKALLFICIATPLAGCEHYFDREDKMTAASGEAHAANRATHMVDPWPASSSRRAFLHSGERIQKGFDNYKSAGTSSSSTSSTSSSSSSSSSDSGSSSSSTAQ